MVIWPHLFYDFQCWSWRFLFYLREVSLSTGCNDYFTPIHLQPIYKELGYGEGDFPVTEAVAARTIALPFYNNLREEEIDYVVSQIKELL